MDYGDRMKIATFKDLKAWRACHDLVLDVYQVLDKFPLEERYALCDQMRRAGISTTSNIAEGFSRNTYKDKIQFYSIASVSLTELQSQMMLARDLKYITEAHYSLLDEKFILAAKLVHGLIRSTKKLSYIAIS